MRLSETIARFRWPLLVTAVLALCGAGPSPSPGIGGLSGTAPIVVTPSGAGPAARVLSCPTCAATGAANTWTSQQNFGTVVAGRRAVSATSYTLVAADSGVTLLFTSGSAVTVTIPGGLLAQGAYVTIVQGGAGAVTVTAGGGVTVNSPHSFTKTNGAHTLIGLYFEDAYTADLFGDGA